MAVGRPKAARVAERRPDWAHQRLSYGLGRAFWGRIAISVRGLAVVRGGYLTYSITSSAIDYSRKLPV